MIESSKETWTNDGLGVQVIQDHRDGQRSLRAAIDFKPGDTISIASRDVIDAPTTHSIQIDRSRHIELDPPELSFIAHSCEPNVRFDVDSMRMVFLKPVRKGELFSAFYPSTEWDMTSPFACHCGSAGCIGEIRGARYLSNEIRSRYGFSNYIQSCFLSIPT